MIRRYLTYCLLLFVFATSTCFAAEIKQGTISGKWITKNDGPMANAQVLLFDMAVGPPPASEKYLRVPDVTTSIDNEGKFSVQVPPGRYYLVMRKRADESTFGPPQDGDLQYYSRDNRGKAKLIIVKAGKETKIGTISEASVFKKRQTKYEIGMTAIEGTVTDEDGKPLEGLRVFVYISPEMVGKPQYASEGTGNDGKYLINVNNEGTYYLKVRSHYGGGKPVNGEFMGGYGTPDAPAVVNVKKGQIKSDINISIQKFVVRGKPE